MNSDIDIIQVNETNVDNISMYFKKIVKQFQWKNKSFLGFLDFHKWVDWNIINLVKETMDAKNLFWVQWSIKKKDEEYITV